MVFFKHGHPNLSKEESVASSAEACVYICICVCTFSIPKHRHACTVISLAERVGGKLFREAFFPLEAFGISKSKLSGDVCKS